jgi:hypothetical protein
VRRAVATTLAAAVVTTALAACANGSARSVMPACSRPDQHILVLEAQAVPSATQLPCVAELPAGWSYSGFDIRRDAAQFWLDNDRAGIHAVEVTLAATCDTSGAVAVEPDADEAVTKVFQEPTSLPPGFTGYRFLVFDGGCISYRYTFGSGADPSLTLEAQEALSLVGRGLVVDMVRTKYGLTLCGAEAPPCVG